MPADPSFEFGGESVRHAYYVALSYGSLFKAARHDEPNWEVIIEGGQEWPLYSPSYRFVAARPGARRERHRSAAGARIRASSLLPVLKREAARTLGW